MSLLNKKKKKQINPYYQEVTCKLTNVIVKQRRIPKRSTNWVTKSNKPNLVHR